MKREERIAVADFGERYQARDVAAAFAVERGALGTEVGVNGYTTLAQAETLADLLALDSNDRVLDLGCGCGWPGLHLARRSGCSVVGADLPLEGLLLASRKAQEWETSGHRVCASARHLPFRRAAFDAIVHADVLC